MMPTSLTANDDLTITPHSLDTHMIIYQRYVDSPVGPLRLAASDAGVRLIEFPKPNHPIAATGDWRDGTHPLIDRACEQLDAYFAGKRKTFDLPLDPHGTDFQRVVWNELSRIPYGETISYAQLSMRIGKASAMRAVGAANGRNPLPIVVPCHRVIGADGSLTGFGGGLPTKQFLLALEGAIPPRADQLPLV